MKTGVDSRTSGQVRWFRILRPPHFQTSLDAIDTGRMPALVLAAPL